MAKPTKPDPSDVLSALQQHSPASHLGRVRSILEEILVLYYPPFRAEDETELLRLAIVGMRPYVEDLAEFKPDIIETAWRNVRRGHKVLTTFAGENWRTGRSQRAGTRRSGCIARTRRITKRKRF